MESDAIWLGVVALGWLSTSALIGCAVLILNHREAERRIHDQEVAHQEITKRLEESETRLRAIIESEPECVKLQASDGTVLEINPAGLTLLDAGSPAEIIGKPIYNFVAPDFIPFYKENMRRVFSGESMVYEFKSITLKGRVCWMETHAVPLRDEQGTVYALLGITRDITEHKWALDQARQHQLELARVARLSTMGEMATGLAHELNQPLAAIANFTRGCIHRLRSGKVAPTELIEPLEEVCEQAERAGEIMRHVRDFVRKSEPRIIAADINQIVRSVAKFVELETRQQDARVTLELAEDLPQVQADAIMIEQVICNLVRNAVEAMVESNSPQREITICTKHRDAGDILVEVGDTGPGISRSIADKIFDQFFTTKREGVGMGLSISRSIIESHGGKLRALPQPDSGTVFTFSLRTFIPGQPNDERAHRIYH
ncbi:MAG: PAS domain S-box protein [Proteobacteria bacterium]|nr:MAG: PAS domain S-box protein [Pseudomonadota bacterium]